MAEKEQHSAYPANGYGHAMSGDSKAAADHNARELKRQKRKNLFINIAVFIIFQIAVITVISLILMRVKTTELRLRGASFTKFNTGDPATPSLQVSMVPQFSMKNANFGRYKYQTTTVDFFYQRAKIGEAVVPNSKAGWRSTKRFLISAVDLNIAASPQLTADMSAGVVPISGMSRMRGKVELMFIMKKNKETNMDCTMEIVTATQTLRKLFCT